MRIQNINNYINYNGNTKPVKQEKTIKRSNYDVIEISRSGKDMTSDELDKVKSEIVSRINEETNSEKIARLKESINNKTYKIDVDEIVDRMLDK
jgi:anti-sigma28 factor (negative regulator of flagellin synthesis)